MTMTAAPASTVFVKVHCTGTIKTGRLAGHICNNVLIAVALDDLEKKLIAGKQQILCDRCGEVEDFSRWR